MYVEILANAEVQENATRLKIVKAPSDFLLNSKFRLQDILEWKDLDIVQEFASKIGYTVNIQYSNRENKYPIPAISEEMEHLIAEFPFDLKIKLNGMVFEQRLYAIAILNHL